MIVYISESRDREGNSLYEAAICEGDGIIETISDYDRKELVEAVLRQYPETEIDNG